MGYPGLPTIDESYGVPMAPGVPGRALNAAYPMAPGIDESYAVPGAPGVPGRPRNAAYPMAPSIDESYAVPMAPGVPGRPRNAAYPMNPGLPKSYAFKQGDAADRRAKFTIGGRRGGYGYGLGYDDTIGERVVRIAEKEDMKKDKKVEKAVPWW